LELLVVAAIGAVALEELSVSFVEMPAEFLFVHNGEIVRTR
jgi:hypothetical protein